MIKIIIGLTISTVRDYTVSNRLWLGTIKKRTYFYHLNSYYKGKWVLNIFT